MYQAPSAAMVRLDSLMGASGGAKWQSKNTSGAKRGNERLECCKESVNENEISL